MCNQFTRCWAEIDIAALSRNLCRLKDLSPEIIAVVKADAYGHGTDIIVPALHRLGVRHFSVATVGEAAALRRLLGITGGSIYLMAAVLAADAESIVELQLIPFATDTDFVRSLGQAALRQGKIAPVHIEVDTGIGRAGVDPNDLLSTLLLWSSLPGILVAGICTHFTAADAAESADGEGQMAIFQQSLAEIPPHLLSGLSIHAANSPAALRTLTERTSFFRPGLLLYGISPAESMTAGFLFEPVLSLHARVLLVRRLPAGTDISYSRTYRLPTDATIATIGIGYGDGFPRRLSNFGKVLLPDGTPAPIRGRICMDQLCVEVPENVNLTPGDTVTLVGVCGENRITVSEIADLIDTTPHEITTCLTARIPRHESNQFDEA
jgi:alanine racemase